MKNGEVPMINVANRKWNDDSVAAIVDFVLPNEVSLHNDPM